MRDEIFKNSDSSPKKFEFDASVADVFPDMLNRSIPFYQGIVFQSGVFAARFALAGSTIYDLGCSHGAVSLEIAKNIPADSQIVAIDNSEAMVQRCTSLLERSHLACRYTVIKDDVGLVSLTNASFAVMNFTLQFIEPAQRTRVISSIYSGLLPGGALMLSEKNSFENPTLQKRVDDFYYDFKRANGYSEMEIARKREALENVLVSDSDNLQQSRLQEAGFKTVYRWFSCFAFSSYIAVK